MDPDVALREIREIAGSSDQPSEAGFRRLAELVDGLDTWLTNGGFLPTDWHLASAAKGDRLYPPPR
jgi:hypothetical protein